MVHGPSKKLSQRVHVAAHENNVAFCSKRFSYVGFLVRQSLQAVFDALSRKSADPMLQSIGIPFDKFQEILALLQVTCATSSDHAAVMKSATEAGIQTDKVDKETMAFYSGFIESALCTQGADASTWANSWAMVIQKVHTSCSLLPLKALFPEQSSADKPTIGTIEQPAGETPGEKSVKNDARLLVSFLCFWCQVCQV